MLVRFLSYQGKEGFGENFHGEYELGGETLPCTIRWAPEPRNKADKDNPLARVRDAGLLMQLYPDPLIPRVLAVTPCWNGLAVVSEVPGGIRLADIEQRPFPEPVILEIMRQLCAMLDRVYTRTDESTGELLRTLHRAISTECVHLRPEGRLRVTGFEKMSTVWAARAAETSAMATHPGARLAPEQMSGEVFHATDVYLAGLVGIDLLVAPDRASQFSRMLAMCICDPEGFEEIREQVIADPSVEASTNLRGLFRAMLQEDPKSRPAASVIAAMCAAVGADEQALQGFAADFEVPPAPEGLFHQFVGRSLDLPDPSAPAPAPEPAAAVAPAGASPDDEAQTDVGLELPTGAGPGPTVVPLPSRLDGARQVEEEPEVIPAPDDPEATEMFEAPAEPDQAPAAVTPPKPPPVTSVTPASAPAVESAEEPLPEPVAPAPPAAAEEPAPEPAPQPARPSADRPLAEKPTDPEPEQPFEPPVAADDDGAVVDRPKKSKLPLIIGAVVLLFLLGVVACAGGFALLYFL